jgi:hypothetical protein
MLHADNRRRRQARSPVEGPGNTNRIPALGRALDHYPQVCCGVSAVTQVTCVPETALATHATRAWASSKGRQFLRALERFHCGNTATTSDYYEQR